MNIPVVIRTRYIGKRPADYADSIEELAAVEESVILQVFERFRALLAAQLKQNRTTQEHISGGVKYRGPTFEQMNFSTGKMEKMRNEFIAKPYSAGAYLSTVRTKGIVEKNVGGVIKKSLTIGIGGVGVTNAGTPKDVLYSHFIDKAFGPRTVTINKTVSIFGGRRGGPERFATLRRGRTYSMNQPVDSKVAWDTAIREFRQKFTQEVREISQKIAKNRRETITYRNGISRIIYRDSKGRFARR
jgi:hypothetical protein